MPSKILTCGLLIAMIALAGCSSDDEAAPEDPILTITNQWTDENDSEHVFDLRSDDDGEKSGTFTGQEAAPDDDSFDLTGSWTRGSVTFTVERTEDVTYTAAFDTDNQTRLVFRSGGEADIILTRGK